MPLQVDTKYYDIHVSKTQYQHLSYDERLRDSISIANIWLRRIDIDKNIA